MAKCKRILSVVLSVAMVLTLVPMSLTATAVSQDTAVETAASDAQTLAEEDNTDGALVIPVVTLESTNVIRIADANNPFTIGNSIVAATPSGLPQITSDYSAAYYCGETPSLPTVVFTVDKELAGTPTIACENNTGISFSDPAVSKNAADGTTTYTWTITSGTNVPVGALRFVVGYTYSYVDALTNKTYTRNYNAYATSYVENASQPGSMYIYRERTEVFHSEAICNGVARILGANTYGSFYYIDDADAASAGWDKGYYDFINGEQSFVSVSDTVTGAAGYGMVKYQPGSNSTGNVTANEALDHNRPQSTTYVDRSTAVNLNFYNLRLTMFMSQNKSSHEYYARYSGMKIFEGLSSFDDTSVDNNASRTQLGIPTDATYTTDQQVAGHGFSSMPFEGTTYDDAATTLENGNRRSEYTLVGKIGGYYVKRDRVSNVSYAINMIIESYDKAEVRGLVKETLTEQEPTTMIAANSEIGIYPQASYYSAGWDAYKEALQNSQAILNKPNTNQADIDATYATLETAISGLVVAEADYSVIDATLEQLSTKSAEDYTDESWANVQLAVNNVTRGYSVFYQPAVDAMAVELNQAITALQYAPADYTNVNTVVEEYEKLDATKYTAESWAYLRDTVNSVDYTLDVTKQGIVDGYAVSIQNAMDALQDAPADYTEWYVQAARYENEYLPNASLFEELSWKRATAAYNSIELDLTWQFQQDVDDYTENLKTMLDNIKYKSADYSLVDEAVAKYEALTESWYTPASYKAVDDAVNAVVRGYDIRRQADVTAMATAINDALGKLVEASANYDKVDTAIEYVDNQLKEKNYTAESWANLQNVIASVDWTLNARYQDTVDGYADAINAAVAALEEVSADYSAIEALQAEWDAFPNKSNYTNTSAVNQAFDAVDYTLKISQQATVDGYAEAIRTAMNNLSLKSANYAAVVTAKNAAQAKITAAETFAEKYNGHSYYTEESYKALTDAVAAIVTGLDIEHQAEVDAMAAAINVALGNLTPNTAYYGAVDEQVARIPADLMSGNYTEESAADVLVAQNFIERGLTTENQADVDEMAADLKTAIDNLEEKTLDLTEYQEAVNRIPEDTSKYVDEYVTAVENANQACIDFLTNNNKYSNQSEFDEFVATLNAAIDAMLANVKPADYTAVDTAITAAEKFVADNSDVLTEETKTAISDAINAVERGLDIDEQSRVDAMAKAINDAVDNAKYLPLDTTDYYNVVDDIPTDLSVYTDESVTALNEAKANADALLATGNIKDQLKFDILVGKLRAAVDGLERNLADYTALNALLAIIDDPTSEMNTKGYNNIKTVTASITTYRTDVVANNMNLPASEQSKVDEMTATLQGYVDSLYIFKAADGSTTVISGRYIYGLKEKLTKSKFLSDYVTAENVTVSVTGAKQYLGTGAKVTVTTTDGTVVGTYYIVIYGDIDGNGIINYNDSTALSSALNGDGVSGAVKKAANLTGRDVTMNDVNVIAQAADKNVAIDQSKGKIV